MTPNLFRSWEIIIEIAIVTVFAYVLFVLMTRISGKRSLSKMNMFDFIVTVAQGSILAGTVINRSVYLFEGIAASLILFFAQWIVTKLSAHFDQFDELIKSQPKILFYNGRFIDNEMQNERITKEEILYAMRQNGKSSPTEVHAVILETDGQLSVISQPTQDVAKYTIDEIANYDDVR